MTQTRLDDAGVILGDASVVCLVGHAGVGKTNLALNLALADAGAGRSVALADLDLVNPYFRSSDYPAELEAAGVELIAPVFARTTLDTPSLTGELDVAIGLAAATPGARLIIDVGGDDIGATALGRYAARLRDARARVLYLVNAFRNLTATPAECAELLPGIQDNARLAACGVVNCSHVMQLTTADDVARGRTFAAEVARLTDLPLVATAVPEVVGEDVARAIAAEGSEPVFFSRRLVTTPWG